MRVRSERDTHVATRAEHHEGVQRKALEAHLVRRRRDSGGVTADRKLNPGTALIGRGRSGLYEPAFVCEHDGMDPISETQLREDMCDMGPRRVLADDESGGDLLVG